MNRFVYAEKPGNNYQLFLFDDIRIPDDAPDFDALMMSRLDFDIEVIKIPPVHSEEINNLLGYKIRGLYPGSPEETVFDYQIAALRRERYAVLFITKKSILNNYKSLGKNKPLFLPYAMAKPLAGNYTAENCIITFWHTHWTEILFFSRGILKSSFVFKTEKGSMSENFTRFESFLPKKIAGEYLIFICSGENKKILEPYIKKLLPKKESYEILSLEDQLNRIGKKSGFLFSTKQKKNIIPQKLRIRLLILIALILPGLILFKFVSYKGRYKNEVNMRLISMEKSYFQAVSIKNDTDNLEIKLNTLRDKKPVDMYQVLSRISEVLGSKTNIIYFSIEKGSFQIEGIGPNTLALMQRFSSHPDFSNIRLIQIVPVKGLKVEKFRITGIVEIK